MAKELPYFKFEPNLWDNGNIQMCSKESKGLFIDLCSVYWSRLGDLPYALALQKHCNGSPDALQELKKHDIISISEDKITIAFLDEQLSEFDGLSVKRRKAANKRWSDASALQMQSKSNAIRGEEKKGEEKIPPFDPSDYYNSPEEAFEDIKNNEVQMENLLRLVKSYGYATTPKVTVMLAAKKFLSIEGAKDAFTSRTKKDVKDHFINWINKNGSKLHE
jgi:hypothetical protein